jgi:hypothetical protein
MGYIVHHAIIVTSWDSDLLKTAHDKAQKIFPAISNIVQGVRNGYDSFLIPPDGSKEGWDESDAGDIARDEFIAWINTLRHEDGSSSIDWVEVRYSPDDKEVTIKRTT